MRIEQRVWKTLRSDREVPFELGFPLGPPDGVKEHETGTFKRRVTGSYLIKIRTRVETTGKLSLLCVCANSKAFLIVSSIFGYLKISRSLMLLLNWFRLILLEIQQQLTKSCIYLQRYCMTREMEQVIFSLIIIQYFYSPYVTVVFVFQLSLSCDLWPWGK